VPGACFDYLGYTYKKILRVRTNNIIVKRNDLTENRVLIYPKASKLKELKATLKMTIKNSQNLSASELIVRLNPIIKR
jgi:hypothetical protein